MFRNFYEKARSKHDLSILSWKKTVTKKHIIAENILGMIQYKILF